MTLAFWTALVFMALHEIDAVFRKEWRILPMTAFLTDSAGRRLFIWAHVPLALLAWWLLGLGAASGPALVFSGFAVIHVGLHWGFRKHPKNEFNNAVSWGFITGSGVAGAVHLGLWAAA